MQRKGKLISAAEYARQRGLNRSTICRQIQLGKIPTHDGLLDGTEADRARDRNLDVTRRRKAPPPAEADHGDHSALIDALRRICSPAETLAFARVALRAGCTPKQTYIVAGWYPIQPCLALREVAADELNDFQDVQPREWRQLLGKNFNIAAAEVAYEAATGPELKG